MNQSLDYDAMFAGVIGQEYQMLKLICPQAAEMSRLVGEAVADYATDKAEALQVLELGGGTGITSLAILAAEPRLDLLSVDNEPKMQNQAKHNLGAWVAEGRLRFSGDDALSALRGLASNSIDLIATAYTLHNFRADYRQQVIQEMFRVLKPGGQFINGDRYALDDISAHTRNTQAELAGYFKVLTEIERLDVLEHWVIHLFNDESENHIMREGIAIAQMTAAGFTSIQLSERQDVNLLLTANKPLAHF